MSAALLACAAPGLFRRSGWPQGAMAGYRKWWLPAKLSFLGPGAWSGTLPAICQSHPANPVSAGRAEGAQLRVQPCHSDSVTSGRKLAFDGSARRESYHALYQPPTATVMLPNKPSPKSVGFHTCHLFQVMDLQVSCSKMSRSISGPPLGVFFPLAPAATWASLLLRQWQKHKKGAWKLQVPGSELMSLPPHPSSQSKSQDHGQLPRGGNILSLSWEVLQLHAKGCACREGGAWNNNAPASCWQPFGVMGRTDASMATS